MAITPVIVQPGVQLGTTATVIFTAAANTKITAPSFTNVGAASVTLTLSITRAGAATGTVITSAQPIASNAAFLAPELSGQVFKVGDTLTAVASTASSLNAVISGVSF